MILKVKRFKLKDSHCPICGYNGAKFTGEENKTFITCGKCHYSFFASLVEFKEGKACQKVES